MPWSTEETERLYVGVLAIGLEDFGFVSTTMSIFRSAKSCKDRWTFIVRDDALLQYLSHKYGNYVDDEVRTKMAVRLNESVQKLSHRGKRNEETPVNYLMKQAAYDQRKRNVYDP